MNEAPLILSIQSHVAYGYVGNKAAVFPLQRLGFDVVPIHTVQFSNHTGYGHWRGEIFSAQHIHEVILGLEERGILPKVKAVVSGYLGAADLGAEILSLVKKCKSLNPDVIYQCDPVMGDVGRGIFVKEGIVEFFRDHMIHQADSLTPNLFELELLSGISIKTLDDLKHACKIIHACNVKILLVTSVRLPHDPADQISMFVSTHTGSTYQVTTPFLPLDPAPNGSGDVTSALFLAHRLAHPDDLQLALDKTAASVFKIFEITHSRKSRELALIESQNYF
jgi:pyridoxine kinase